MVRWTRFGLLASTIHAIDSEPNRGMLQFEACVAGSVPGLLPPPTTPCCKANASRKRSDIPARGGLATNIHMSNQQLE